MIATTRGLPPRLGTVGLVLGSMLLGIYLGRLLVLNAHNPLIVAPAVLTGFILSPVWYLWLGSWLLKADVEERMSRTTVD